jgi:hypothetical protein
MHLPYVVDSAGTAATMGGAAHAGHREGGSITVTYDPQAKPFLDVIHLFNQGGPPPVLKEEPVAALW